jgi:hypothetical protein
LLYTRAREGGGKREREGGSTRERKGEGTREREGGGTREREGGGTHLLYIAYSVLLDGRIKGRRRSKRVCRRSSHRA